MYQLIKVVTVILIVTAVPLFLAGCQEKGEHPSGTDHPSGEHPTQEAPVQETPASEHPSGEHPSGEHPQ